MKNINFFIPKLNKITIYNANKLDTCTKRNNHMYLRIHFYYST